MVHSSAERLQDIQKRLKEITNKVIQRQNQNTKDLIIEDEEFQYIMAFCAGTSRYWRDLDIVEYTQKDSEFYYTIEAVNKMLVKEFGALKKK